jgi:hypothetical protein
MAFVAMALLAPHVARANAFTYSSNAKKIYAAYVNVTSADLKKSGQRNTEEHPDPFVFYILNNRTDVLPTGWQFVNPLAPAVVTSAIGNSSSGLYPTLSSYVGQPVTPNMACYWQVDINQLSLDNINNFDFLVIHCDGIINLNPTQRAIFRQFLERGGTLFLDAPSIQTSYEVPYPSVSGYPQVGYSGMSSGSGLIFDVQWCNNKGATGYPTLPDGVINSLLTAPYNLTLQEINTLGENNVGGYYMTNARAASNTSSSSAANPDSSIFSTVLLNSGNSKPYISAGTYGGGHIIVSAANICGAISQPVSKGTQNDATNPDICVSSQSLTAEPPFNLAATADLKFFVNVVSYGEDMFNGEGSNPRHSMTSGGELYGTMLPLWTYAPDLIKAPGASPSVYSATSSTPAVYGNVAFITDGVGYLHAFDINPSEDLALSGSADNGITQDGVDTLFDDPRTGLGATSDLSLGLSYDKLWTGDAAAGKSISSPTVGVVPYNGSSTMMVVFEDSSGTVYGYNASLSGGLITTWAGAGSGSFAAGSLPPAPVIYRGRIFAVQPNSTLLVIDPVHPYNGSVSDNSKTSFSLNIKGTGGTYYTPSVALVPSDDGIFGGEDIVVTVTSSTGTDSIIVGSVDEQLAITSSGASTYYSKIGEYYPTAASGLSLISAPEDRPNASGSLLNWIYASSVDFSLNNETAPDFSGTVGSSPSITGSSTITPSGYDSDTDSTNPPPYYADYDLTASSGSSANPAFRYIYAPNLLTSTGTPYYISGSGSVTPGNETAYLANQGSLSSGTLTNSTGYATLVLDRNYGTSNHPTIPWRFALVGTLQAPVTDADGIQYAFSSYHFVGSPITGPNNAIYALAVSETAGSAIVMCFNPSPWIHTTLTGVSVSANQTLLVQQPDDSKYVGITSASGYPSQTSTAMTLSTLNASQYSTSISSDGTITYLNLNDFNGLSTLSTQLAGGTASLEPNVGFPMPIYVSAATASGASSSSKVLMSLSSENNGAPLLTWWAPAFASDTVDTASLSNLHMSMVGNWLYITGAKNSSDGSYYVYSMDAADLGLVSGINSTTRELNDITSSTYHKKFVSSIGQITSPLAVAGRFGVAQGSDTNTNDAASNNIGGIEGFGNLTTLVSDNNRLVEFDPSGDLDWSSTVTSSIISASSNSSTQVTFNRPGTITQISANDFLVADSGNNRCVRVDRSGNVLWELSSFADPHHLLSNGSKTTLSLPSSVTLWITTSKSGTITYYTYHYLISDTGNYRIIEVDDLLSQDSSATTGMQTVQSHVLVWTTHTYDQQGKQYRYVAAQRYLGPDQNWYILGAVSNKRIAPVLANSSGVLSMQSVNSDVDGSSLVALYYVPYGSGYTYGDAVSGDYGTDGNGNGGKIVYRFVSGSIQVPFPLITMKTYPAVLSSTNLTAAVISASTQRLRSLRFLSDYFRYTASGESAYNAQRTVICDDDGVFDAKPVLANMTTGVLTPLSQLGAAALPAGQYSWTLYAYVDQLSAGGANTASSTYDANAFSFIPNDYTNWIAPYRPLNEATPTYTSSGRQLPYRGTSFVPSSAMLLPNGDYLIANRASSGETITADQTGFGGNIFEVNPSNMGVTGANAYSSNTASTSPVIGVWGIPTNGSTVNQPAFALRPQ